MSTLDALSTHDMFEGLAKLLSGPGTQAAEEPQPQNVPRAEPTILQGPGSVGPKGKLPGVKVPAPKGAHIALLPSCGDVPRGGLSWCQHQSVTVRAELLAIHLAASLPATEGSSELYFPQTSGTQQSQVAGRFS